MNDDKMSKIDAAIAASQARKAQKKGTPVSDVSMEAPRRKRLTEEERAARDEQRASEKARRTQARLEKKAQRARDREAARAAHPAHMVKVEKARAKLPVMSEGLTKSYDALTSGFSPADIDILCKHLALHVRASRTQAALKSELTVGQTVLITGGDPRYRGMTGTVSEARTIRCFVNIPSREKPVYLFISEVTPVNEVQTLSQDGENEEAAVG